MNSKLYTGYHRFCDDLSTILMMNTTLHAHQKLRLFNKAKQQDSLKLKCLGLLPKWIINSEQSQSSENQNDTWDGILREDALSVSGDRKMIRLEYVLSNIPEMVRHEYQRMFHREMEMAMLPKIYDTEWDSDSNSILRKYNQTTHRAEKLIVCPRRFGKTASIVMYIVAVLYVIPNITIAVFSTCQRTAGKLVAWATKLLGQLPGFDTLREKVNSEEIILKFSIRDRRTLNCYPGLVAKRYGIVVDSRYFLCQMQFTGVSHPNTVKIVETNRINTVMTFFPDYTTTTDRDSNELILPQGGTKLNESLHKIVNVPGDGNCFFHAVLSSIRNQITLPPSRDHINFRLDCCALIYLIIFKPSDVPDIKERPPFLFYKPGELSNKLFQIAHDIFRHLIDTGAVDIRALPAPPPTSTRFFQWLKYDARTAMSSYLSNSLAERLVDMIYFYYGIREKHEPRYHANKEQQVTSLYKTAGNSKSSLEQCFVTFSQGCRAMLGNKSKLGEMVSVWPFAQVIASGFGYNVHYTVEQTSESDKRKLEAWWTSTSSILRPVYYNSESEYGTLRSIVEGEGNKEQSSSIHTILLYYSGEHYKSIHFVRQVKGHQSESRSSILPTNGSEAEKEKKHSINIQTVITPFHPSGLTIIGKKLTTSPSHKSIHEKSSQLQTTTKSSFIDFDINENGTIGVDANNWEYIVPSYHYSNIDNTGITIKLTDPINLYIYNMKDGLKSAIGSFLMQTQFRITFVKIPESPFSLEDYSEVQDWRMITLSEKNPEFSKQALTADSPVLVNIIYVFDLSTVESPNQRINKRDSNNVMLLETGLNRQFVYSLGNTKAFIDQYKDFEIEMFQCDAQKTKVERIGFKKQYEEEPCHFVTTPILQDHSEGLESASEFTSAPRYLIMLLKNYNLNQLTADWYFIDPTKIQKEETSLMSEVLLNLQ